MDWKDIAIGLVPFAAGFAVLRAIDAPTPQAALPTPAPPPGTTGGPVQLSGDPVTAVPGRTYFAVVKTSGLVSSAANPKNVEAKARELGFTDVVVFTTPPSAWPGTARGDYYVRATYTAPQPRTLQRKTSVGFVGGVEVVDVFEST